MKQLFVKSLSEIRFSADVSLADINALYKRSGESGRASPSDVRLGLYLNNELVCAARLQRYDCGWLLRNVCTLPDHRSQGLASLLLDNLRRLHLEEGAGLLRQDAAPIFTLPLPHLNDFYRRNGFVVVKSPHDPDLQRVFHSARKRHSHIQWMKLRPLDN